MKPRAFCVHVLVIAYLVLVASAKSAGTEPVVVNGPTIVAYFPPVTQSAVDADQGLSETLGDFQFHLRTAEPCLKKAGIAVFERYGVSFDLRDGSAGTIFRPKTNEIGYYFIAPGRKPRIERSLIADVGLLQIAREYFGLNVPECHAQ
jgi:hypothetical protein